MDNNKLSERDLLIELRTEVKNFKEYVTEELKSIKKVITSNQDELDNMKNDLSGCKVKIDENTRFRVWVYGAIISGIISIVLSFADLLK